MKKNRFPYLLHVVLLAFVTFVGLSGSARGAMLSPGDFLTGTNWTVTWNDPSLKLDWIFDGDPRITGNVQGILTKTVTFQTLDPISIFFHQDNPTSPPPGKNSTFGLRFTMDEVITNNTGSKWDTFTLTTLEGANEATIEAYTAVLEADGVGGSLTAHPVEAHMHNDKMRCPPFDCSDTFPGPVSETSQGTSEYEFSSDTGALFGPGTQNWRGIGVHEWEIKELADEIQFRSFRLFEQPHAAPEPSTILLVASGLIGLVVWRRARERFHGPHVG